MNLLSFIGGIAFANLFWCFQIEKLIKKHKNEIQIMERSQEIIVCDFMNCKELSGAGYSIIGSAVDQAWQEKKGSG